jgi:ABC-type polysaccharide/polyol phosphate export permease
MWKGEYFFLLRSLILKDFRTRYRNMSLGILWSLVNPLVMMGVMTFVFTKIYPLTTSQNYPVFVLCGLVPFNFFSLAWANGTTSIIDNAQLIKRLPVPRETLPIASVMGNAVHLAIQVALLLVTALVLGTGINRYWLWLPLLWACELIFVLGCALLCSALDVYVRDMRYVVESACLVLFWLVPIFYDLSRVRPEYADIYQFNPIAALVLALRNIILEGKAPRAVLLSKLFFVSCFMLGLGWSVFRRLNRRFYDYL